MAKNVIVDSGALIALLRRDDQHHQWVAATAEKVAAPWQTCDAALSEAFFLIGRAGRPKLAELLRRRIVVSSFSFDNECDATLGLMDKYDDVPMSLADACLVRMTEMLTDPVLITTDGDFRFYRRYSRQVIPCLMPL
jgi:predicted nucleic acid-binding protein